jgi:hypothetical protein
MHNGNGGVNVTDKWQVISSEQFDRIRDALDAIKARGAVLTNGQWITPDGKMLRVEYQGVGRGFRLIASVKKEEQR